MDIITNPDDVELVMPRVSDGLSTFDTNEDGTTTVVRFGMRLNTFTSRAAAESFAARTFWVYA